LFEILFFWNIALHHWIISSQHFIDTAFLQNIGTNYLVMLIHIPEQTNHLYHCDTSKLTPLGC